MILFNSFQNYTTAFAEYTYFLQPLTNTIIHSR